MSMPPFPWTIYRCSYCEEGRACGFNGEALDHSMEECHHPLTMEEAEYIVRACNVMAEFRKIVLGENV